MGQDGKWSRSKTLERYAFFTMTYLKNSWKTHESYCFLYLQKSKKRSSHDQNLSILDTQIPQDLENRSPTKNIGVGVLVLKIEIFKNHLGSEKKDLSDFQKIRTSKRGRQPPYFSSPLPYLHMGGHLYQIYQVYNRRKYFFQIFEVGKDNFSHFAQKLPSKLS